MYSRSANPSAAAGPANASPLDVSSIAVADTRATHIADQIEALISEQGPSDQVRLRDIPVRMVLARDLTPASTIKAMFRNQELTGQQRDLATDIFAVPFVPTSLSAEALFDAYRKLAERYDRQSNHVEFPLKVPDEVSQVVLGDEVTVEGRGIAIAYPGTKDGLEGCHLRWVSTGRSGEKVAMLDMLTADDVVTVKRHTLQSILHEAASLKSFTRISHYQITTALEREGSFMGSLSDRSAGVLERIIRDPLMTAMATPARVRAMHMALYLTCVRPELLSARSALSLFDALETVLRTDAQKDEFLDWTKVPGYREAKQAWREKAGF